MARRKRPKLAVIARRTFFFVAGSLFAGFAAIFLHALLRDWARSHSDSPAGAFLGHLAAPLAVGLAVAATFWLLRLVKHPPIFLDKVPPLAAGLCAGLGVHLARLWIR